MNSIETALLASISHQAELYNRWRRLIAQASPAGGQAANMRPTSVASPKRTKIAVWA